MNLPRAEQISTSSASSGDDERDIRFEFSQAQDPSRSRERQVGEDGQLGGHLSLNPFCPESDIVGVADDVVTA
jgi:hypothetical protein